MKKKTSPMSLEEMDDIITMFLNQSEGALRQHMAAQIIIHATILAANNLYEGIGLIEDCKIHYREFVMEVMGEE